MNEIVYCKEREVEVTKEFTFDSAHHLECYQGDCANLHGHTYKLHVTMKGKLNNIGMVIDFKDLSRIVKEVVVNRLDHKMLNHILNYNPTAENMVLWIHDELTEALQKEDLRGVKVTSVVLWETPTSFAEYRG